MPLIAHGQRHTRNTSPARRKQIAGQMENLLPGDIPEAVDGYRPLRIRRPLADGSEQRIRPVIGGNGAMGPGIEAILALCRIPRLALAGHIRR